MNEIIKIENGHINYDFTGLRNSIDAKLGLYRGIQFTEDSKKDAKATVAELRKDQKELQARVKEVKAAWMKPFDDFAEEAMDVIALYNAPIDSIGKQVQEFEEKRRAEKIEHIKVLYLEMVDEDIQELMPLETIYDARWENATANDKSIRESISKEVVITKSDMTLIKSFHSPIEDEIIATYKHNRNLAPLIDKLRAYEQMQERIRREEYQRELERIKEQARKDLITEMNIENAVQEAVESFIPVDDGSEEGMYSYRIFLNDDAKAKLEAFMDSVGIRYEVR